MLCWIVWLTAVQILKVILTGMYKESCPLCAGKEEAEHIYLYAVHKLKIEFLSKICKDMNEESTYRKIMNCPNKTQIRNLWKHLYKVQCKLETTVTWSIVPQTIQQKLKSLNK